LLADEVINSMDFCWGAFAFKCSSSGFWVLSMSGTREFNTPTPRPVHPGGGGGRASPATLIQALDYITHFTSLSTQHESPYHHGRRDAVATSRTTTFGRRLHSSSNTSAHSSNSRGTSTSSYALGTRSEAAVKQDQYFRQLSFASSQVGLGETFQCPGWWSLQE